MNDSRPEAPAEAALTAQPSQQEAALSWPELVRKGKDSEIRKRLATEVNALVKKHEKTLAGYCVLAILEPDGSIDKYDLDQIYESLQAGNASREKDVLLILLSPGGSIEPAYQISKLCKSRSKNRFVVAIPREAKSAATLIALGADEIHMGPLGQLGPIDPQIGGRPALGVTQALDVIAELCERRPGAAELFARYLQRVLTVEQIGYCYRIGQSASQYAERLLQLKPAVAPRASKIAQVLVNEYKDHGFVIDLAEARLHLGNEWVKTDTSELAFSEELYELFATVDLFLDINHSKKIYIIGAPDRCLIFPRQKK